MRIVVTQNDITNGKRGQGSLCPVALALRRTTGLLMDVALTNIIVMNTKRMSYETPYSVSKFVRDFDGGNSVKPFAFNLPMEMESHAY